MTAPVVDPAVAALTAVRRYCRWHVAPVVTETITLDGPGGDLLILPTLRMEPDSLEVTENGVVIGATALEVSSRGLVRRTDGQWWTCKFGGITVTYTHGFDEASDWWSVVQAYQGRAATQTLFGGAPTRVGPFYFGADEMGAGSVFTDEERPILDLYRLEASQR